MIGDRSQIDIAYNLEPIMACMTTDNILKSNYIIQ